MKGEPQGFDKWNRVKQSEEPRTTSRFGATGLLFSEKGNNRVVIQVGEERFPPGVPFWMH